MNFHDLGHEFARLIEQEKNDPAVRDVAARVIDRLTDKVVDETPAVAHPLVRHYIHVLEGKLEAHVKAEADPRQAGRHTP